MAELNIFHYRPGRSPVHRIDGRVKLLLLILTVISVLSTGTIGLAVVSIVTAAAAAAVPLNPAGFRRELIVFAVLAAIIWISRPGFEAGAVAAWRFILVVSAGMIFSAVTAPEEIHGVLFTLLAPIPRLPHGLIAEHVSLTILFIPLLFDTAKEIGEARKTRLIGENRNPVGRLASFASPLLEALFARIEEVALALEARCFDQEAVRFELHLRRTDIITAAAGALLSTAVILWG
ncbi:MAG: energy-coupling factor transporter transmembrane component T family protein [Spirochaetaceae bacterium]